MSTTRNLIANLSVQNPSYEMVNLRKAGPTKSFLIASMPCEIKAAAIRNKTIDSMEANNIGDVAYRFLQTRRGENNTFIMAALCFAATIMAYWTNSTSYLSYFPILHVPPNIANTIRYRETKQASEKWLTDRLGRQKTEQIKNLTFNQEGMFKLVTFLKQEKIDATSIERKDKKNDQRFSCLNMDR